MKVAKLPTAIINLVQPAAHGSVGSVEVGLPEAYHSSHSRITVRHEEDALCWFWAYPQLLPWLTAVYWLYTPVVGNSRWPGDLWGVDANGELLVLECKQCRRGDSPFHDFVAYHRRGRDEFTASHWLAKWRRHLSAERTFTSATTIRPAGRTDGLLPRSNKRAHIRRWPELATRIDMYVRSTGYERGVETALACREARQNPPPHYGALMVVSGDDAVLTPEAVASGYALRALVGTENVHVVITEAVVAGPARVRLSGRMEWEW